MHKTTRQEVDDFLAQKRIALVGMSRDPKDFSRYVYNDLTKRGYDVVPVNPQMTGFDGQRCYARVQEIAPPVAGALVMTPAAQSEQVVRDCAEAGITRVWLHRATGPGAVSDAAVDFCEQHQMHLVAGHCPLMFLPHTPFFHRIHGFFLKLGGTYPVLAK